MNLSVKHTMENLERNGFTVKYFTSTKEAKKTLLEEIEQSKSVAFGGSMTLTDMGIMEALEERGNVIFNHNRTSDPEERKRLLKCAVTADIYMSSSNAITEDGKLVNIDGSGNRLAGLLFGHERVYVVAGTNKIARSTEDAMIRVKNQAAPQNAKRLGCDTPCAVTGKCGNCDALRRICKATLIMDRQMSGGNLSVYLIDEALGY